MSIFAQLSERAAKSFHAVSRERFEAALDDLESHAAEEGADARYVGLMAAINLIVETVFHLPRS